MEFIVSGYLHVSYFPPLIIKHKECFVRVYSDEKFHYYSYCVMMYVYYSQFNAELITRLILYIA